MHVRRAVALLAGLAGLIGTLFPGVAFAWQEAHEIADDAHVVVDARGVAAEEHTLRWHIVHGPVPWVDLAGVEPRAVVEPRVDTTTDDGKPWAAHAARRDDGAVRISIDESRGLVRGRVTFVVHWTLDLVAAGRVTRDGSVARLDWSAPVAADGIDNLRAVFDLPAAPGAPRPIIAASGLVDDAASATWTRGPARDVLALMRPHVSRGEAPGWTLRIDSRSLPLVTDPRLHAPDDRPRSGAGPRPGRRRALGRSAVGVGLRVRWPRVAEIARIRGRLRRARGHVAGARSALGCRAGLARGHGARGRCRARVDGRDGSRRGVRRFGGAVRRRSAARPWCRRRGGPPDGRRSTRRSWPAIGRRAARSTWGRGAGERWRSRCRARSRGARSRPAASTRRPRGGRSSMRPCSCPFSRRAGALSGHPTASGRRRRGFRRSSAACARATKSRSHRGAGPLRMGPRPTSFA